MANDSESEENSLMANVDDKENDQNKLLEEVADNPGARTAAIHQNPELMQQEARNAAAGEGPNASGGSGVSAEAEDHVSSSSDPEPSDLPTANSPRRD
ncbi:hypothetical protein VB780_09310 [Leptolyngbya sp. CCNP1308]|uniref:hypothetical protein n=1 Tax=Leptolyngbya sp. CCNP1308 TaxID=3110255 RepID=UPI002B1FAB74|nr:hypothetical protein [Leptolyngbya sp. CCNP1308]MEA5448763.1 hypothetical protein [Leptolyngbya sp. CCNP1308]